MTSVNLEKRKVFGDLRFRRAMSLAINRDELNETVFFGLGEPHQYIGIMPKPDFIDDKWRTYFAEYDPDGANALLDEIGMVDTDGDGFRELPNGEKIVLNLQFSAQELSAQVVDRVSLDWSAVGVQTIIKEITTDEFRSAQSANQLDVAIWPKGLSTMAHLGTNEYWVPPFGDYFNIRTGILWAEWIGSGGSAGVEPPDYAKQMMEDINAFHAAAIGSEEFENIGSRLVKNMVSNLRFIGTVVAPGPIYRRNALKTRACTQLFRPVLQCRIGVSDGGRDGWRPARPARAIRSVHDLLQPLEQGRDSGVDNVEDSRACRPGRRRPGGADARLLGGAGT